MIKSATQFVATAILLGGVSLFLAWYFGETSMLWIAIVAYALTMLPALATFLWIQWTAFSAPDLQLLVWLGGTMVRMAFSLGGGLLIRSTDTEMYSTEFWFWLISFYLVFLTLDIILLLQNQPPLADSKTEDTPKS